jgi:DNA-binding NarL/FixJ family response regulator
VPSLAAGIAASRSGNANAARQQLEDAVDLFNESGAPLGAELELQRARVLIDELTQKGATPSGPPNAPRVTAHEVEVLQLISKGLNNHAIAEQLFISEHTVHRHVANILTKLDAASRSAAVAHAARLGLL